MKKVNTHQMFKTINHEHLDSLIYFVIGDYPKSGLILVECKDGCWFIEQEYGNEFDAISGIWKPTSECYIEPNFYSNREEALTKAIKLMKSLYPILTDEKISEYFRLDDMDWHSAYDSSSKCHWAITHWKCV